MKKLLLIFLVLSFSYTLFSQSTIVLKDVNGVDISGQTRTLPHNTEFWVEIVNEGASSIDIVVEVTEITLPNGNNILFCYESNCYPPVTAIGIVGPGFSLASGATTGNNYFDAVYYNNGSSNLASVTIKFSESGNSANFSTVTLDNSYVSVKKLVADKYSVYPNPASDHVFVNGVQGANSELVIRNIIGKEVKREKISNNSRISVIDLNPGVYLYSIYENGDLKDTKKLIIN